MLRTLSLRVAILATVFVATAQGPLTLAQPLEPGGHPGVPVLALTLEDLVLAYMRGANGATARPALEALR